VSWNATTPGETDNEQFYDAVPLEPHLLYQGEILVEVPFVNMPQDARWLLLRTRSGKPVDEALQQGNLGGIVKVLDSNQSKLRWYNGADGDFVMARLSKRPVLILSQTCDVQTKDFIQIAPIFPAGDDSDHLARLRQGLIISAFWLKANPPYLTEGYADLELIQAVHKSYIKRLLPSQHFRLAHSRTRELQRFITRYFGRPNSFDADSDLAPRDGTYLCVACFYLDAKVTAVALKDGQNFGHCSACGGRGWVLKGR
jgi:hypothetical protein